MWNQELKTHPIKQQTQNLTTNQQTLQPPKHLSQNVTLRLRVVVFWESMACPRCFEQAACFWLVSNFSLGGCSLFPCLQLGGCTFLSCASNSSIPCPRFSAHGRDLFRDFLPTDEKTHVCACKLPWKFCVFCTFLVFGPWFYTLQ